MAGKEIQAIQVQRNDTAAGWAEKNPVLRTGEFGVETDTGKFKIGDGVTTWKALAFAVSENADTLDGKHASAFAAAVHSHSFNDLKDKPTVLDGEDGATYTPSVDAAGNLSWRNDKGRENPEPVNIKGPAGIQGPKGDKGDTGAQGIQGPAGPQGIQGPKGDTGAKGATGAQGPAGVTPTIKAGTVTTGAAGSSAAVTASTSGTTTTFNFTIPQGAKGATGAQGIQGPKGDKGDTGAKGATGPQGPAGATPTIKAGTVTTGAAGTNAAVTAATSGTTTTFNFTIPRGATGATGPQGPKGDTGPSGATAAVATTTTNGLMAAADKVKLDGIATGANKYVHPSSHPASIITQDATHRFVADTEKTTWNGKANANHTHSYLPLTGGTMSGNVKYTLFNSTQTPFEVYGGDADGQGIAIGAGGSTIVGSGESKEKVKSNLAATGEKLYLSSDYEIVLGTNLQSSWGARKEIRIDTSGQIYAVDGTKKVYHTGNKPTAAEVGAAAASHTHTKAQITDFPTSLKNPAALTVQFNGTTNQTYDGSAAKNVNITPGAIGAATASHGHESLQGITIAPNWNTLRSNLGNPSLLEIAAIESEMDNKLWFYPPANISFEESSDGNSFSAMSVNNEQKQKLVSMCEDAGIQFTKGKYYRITITNSVQYVYLDMLYLYLSTSGNSAQVKIEKRLSSSGAWSIVTNYTNGASGWPGHMVVRHSEIPFTTSTTDTARFNAVRITIKCAPKTNDYANMTLYRLAWYGGYPANRRTIYLWDRNKNVTFPAKVSVNGNAANEVYHKGNKPTPAEIGAAPSNHTHTIVKTLTISSSNTWNTVTGSYFYPITNFTDHFYIEITDPQVTSSTRVDLYADFETIQTLPDPLVPVVENGKLVIYSNVIPTQSVTLQMNIVPITKSTGVSTKIFGQAVGVRKSVIVSDTKPSLTKNIDAIYVNKKDKTASYWDTNAWYDLGSKWT